MTGVATADAAHDEAGVVFGGVAMIAGAFYSLHIAILSSASSRRLLSNHLGIACFVNGGPFGIRDVANVVLISCLWLR